MTITLGELAEITGAELQGNSEYIVHHLSTPENAGEGALCCIFQKHYLDQIASCKLAALIISPEFKEYVTGCALFHTNPNYAYAVASRVFSRRYEPTGIHASAVIDASAQIAGGVSVAAHVVIEKDVIIEAGCHIGAQSYIGAGTHIRENSVLRPNVTLLEETKVGKNALLHSGVVIGDDGFGYAPHEGEWHHVEQVGNVVLGDNVEIGSNTTIDRGKFTSTIISDGVKIDNQVQIGHNVFIGENTIMSACSAVAGSTRIGKNCMIAGASGISDHLEIADGVIITAMSRVTHSLEKANTSYSSGTNAIETVSWRRNAVRFSQLNDMAKRLKKLEKQLEGTKD
ncbi:MAG: UDP-3-O-[3-hydroxymyristoyl] glucosamine N-acyltransferase (EC [uncultured Thiotrichaceae bacterium]|uniref:UDP-3-O-acylglucosamine N-acyltransferase n=1 Tax=uncultured Thiotrichaceae bacterium TaxID=298394 RepID=A0A6S6SXR6_9GAMM|nr:MAG: UDP-3-O-[3-hydroxymyristoyl] glucosamine N-acyltransferase (EC [uncultured Thiotrichaceae bacterium]